MCICSSAAGYQVLFPKRVEEIAPTNCRPYAKSQDSFHCIGAADQTMLLYAVTRGAFKQRIEIRASC
jgi:hypothetical protein